jgi:hypothetical protein
MTAAASVEDRLTVVETELNELKKQVRSVGPPAAIPWWEEWFGAFKDDPDYDEAVRLGAEYRKAQPTADDNDDDVRA